MISSNYGQVHYKGMFRRAIGFYKAFKLLNEQETKQHTLVLYFLLCRSIELCLKAFLLEDGVTPEDLPKRNMYGHDLKKILDDVIKRNLVNFSNDEVKKIEILNNPYCKKDFEYFISGKMTLPKVSTVIPIAEKMFNKGSKILYK